MSHGLSIANARGGAVVEAIDAELAKAYGNILDLDTPATSERVVAVKIKIKAVDDDREQVTMAYEVTSKLVGPKPIGIRATLAGTEADAAAFEWQNPQTDLEDYIEDRNTPRVVGGGDDR